MEFLKRSTLALAVTAALGAIPNVARADILAIGGTNVGAPTTVAAFFGGTLVASNSGPVGTATFTGTAITAVYQSNAGSGGPCNATGGCLDFYYQIQTVAGGTDGPNRESFFNFGTFITDVFQVSTNAGLLAGFVNGTINATSSDRSATGVTVGANYANSIFTPGTSSLIYVIRTNATLFTAGVFGVIDGGVSQINSFSPTAVPEPSTVALLATGLIGLVGYTRRRKNNAA